MTKKAVVLLSGGLDSITALAIAKAEGYNCYTISFDYGQRHKTELAAAQKLAEKPVCRHTRLFKLTCVQLEGQL